MIENSNLLSDYNQSVHSNGTNEQLVSIKQATLNDSISLTR
jgi:hypothetical protein